MKLLLCSEGFNTEEIAQKCVELVGKPKESINVAIINEAYAVEENNLWWVLRALSRAKDNFGGNLELVNLLALDLEEVKKRIEKADVMYVLGGHTDYLMSVFEKTGFAKLLPELLKTKVYVGSSAGSMVLGRRLSDYAYLKMYKETNPYGIKKYLELVDFSIMPHIDSPHFPNRKESLTAAIADHAGVVYGLRDDSAVVVNGDRVYTIGSNPLIFNK
jgi:dipeptidase E